MNWSPQQDHALQEVNKWLKDPGSKQCFRLFGFAGTGKTTLSKHLAKNAKGKTLFAAYTGKAAYVLRQKGCGDASTIHSLIYLPREKSRLRLKSLESELSKTTDPEMVKTLSFKIAEERKNLARPSFSLNTDSPILDADLVIIDECSMVDSRIGTDLLSFGCKILVLGDPAQLPPVASGAGFFTKSEPDVMLTEIHRQAKDNPIIHMATLVRNEKQLDWGAYGDSRVISTREVKPELALNADQILVGKNVTRRACNKRVRELLSHIGDMPVIDDKLVCLRNNHERGLLNGSLWSVEDTGEVTDEKLYMSVRPTDGLFDVPQIDVEAWKHFFLGTDRQLPYWEQVEAEAFDFGYALTVHKAQGSQWENVLLFDESRSFRQNSHKWLYTGITRASEHITIIKD